MGKLSGLPTETTFALTDFLAKIKASAAGDVKVTLQNLITAIFANTPAGAVTLGYAQITSTFTSSSGATPTQVPSLTATVTVPDSNKIKITAYSSNFSTSIGPAAATLSIWDGVVNSGTQIGATQVSSTTNGYSWGEIAMAVVAPGAGSKTYNVGISAASGNPSIGAAVTAPSFLLIERIP